MSKIGKKKRIAGKKNRLEKKQNRLRPRPDSYRSMIFVTLSDKN